MEPRIMLNLLLIIILYLIKCDGQFLTHDQILQDMRRRFQGIQYVPNYQPNLRILDVQKYNLRPLYYPYNNYYKSQESPRPQKTVTLFQNGPMYQVVRHINCQISSTLCPKVIEKKPCHDCLEDKKVAEPAKVLYQKETILNKNEDVNVEAILNKNEEDEVIKQVILDKNEEAILDNNEDADVEKQEILDKNEEVEVVKQAILDKIEEANSDKNKEDNFNKNEDILDKNEEAEVIKQVILDKNEEAEVEKQTILDKGILDKNEDADVEKQEILDKNEKVNLDNNEEVEVVKQAVLDKNEDANSDKNEDEVVKQVILDKNEEAEIEKQGILDKNLETNLDKNEESEVVKLAILDKNEETNLDENEEENLDKIDEKLKKQENLDENEKSALDKQDFFDKDAVVETLNKNEKAEKQDFSDNEDAVEKQVLDKNEKTEVLDKINDEVIKTIQELENPDLKEQLILNNGPTEEDIINEESQTNMDIKKRQVRNDRISELIEQESLIPPSIIKGMAENNLTDNMKRFLNQLDKKSLLEVIDSMKQDHVSKAESNNVAFIEETFEKLRQSVTNMNQEDKNLTKRKAHQLNAGSVLELLAEESTLKKQNEDYDYYYSDVSHEENEETEPSFLELMTIANKHKANNFTSDV